MNTFSTDALKALKTKLAGLPSFPRLLIYELALDYCDYASGIISINTLDEVARNFHVTPTPGRKKETINGDTIRNAFRTIKKAKPEYFRFTTKNQRIIIDMPFLRELYQQICNETTQVAAVVTEEVVTPVTLASIEESIDPIALFFGEDVPEDAAASSHVIEDLINKKQTTTTQTTQPFGQKLLISDDFVPNQNTIAEALARGYHFAADLNEIQAFIDYNKAQQTLWADYNPVYLRWLANAAERQQQKSPLKHARRMNHAGSNQHHQTRKPNARDRVRQAYAREFDFNETTGCFTRRSNHANGNDCNPMASAY